MTEQTYTQNWKAYDAAQEHEQEHVEVLLRDLCDLLYQPEYDRGRPRLPVSDMAYCIGLKVYQGMSRRRTMTAVRRARERGFLDCVPSSSTITRYMDDPALTPVLKYLVEESARPLEAVETQFAVDSTGFATNSYVRWYDHKWGKERKEVQWVKCHLMCGVKTNVVTAVEVSEGDANDSPFLPRLLETTVQIFPGAKELSADKAYLSRNNFAAAERAGIDLYVPFKTNSRATHPGRERSRAWEKAYFFYQYHREEFLEHYHMRSDAESTIGMSKAKTGAFSAAGRKGRSSTRCWPKCSSTTCAFWSRPCTSWASSPSSGRSSGCRGPMRGTVGQRRWRRRHSRRGTMREAPAGASLTAAATLESEGTARPTAAPFPPQKPSARRATGGHPRPGLTR